MRGRAVTLGDGFLWAEPNTLNTPAAISHAKPILVGLESLRALQRASVSFGLNRRDIEHIFYNNAMRITGMDRQPANKTESLYAHAKTRIPSGTQLLSKRPEMMAPGRWPAYYREARGCEVWDLDGKPYYDMSTNGIGACVLGYRHDAVTAAVKRRLLLGSMSTLNPREEVDLADRLIELHPWAEQARFARSGGEACAIAVRIARATTRRSVVAICGYHGWQDWYLAANLGESDALRGHLLPGLNPDGVPGELRGTTVPFRFNDIDALRQIIDQYGDHLAAVFMEPCRGEDPATGFLQQVRDCTRRNGTMLIFDEITIGWRLHYGGAHLKYGVAPDMAVFAKALGNGHPISAVIGTTAAMDGAHTSFISSTNWTESIGPAAALAVLDEMAKVDVPAHIAAVGDQVSRIWADRAQAHQLPVAAGNSFPALAKFSFDHPDSERLRTLFTTLMLEKGFLAGTSIYPTMAHDDRVVSLYEHAVDEVFGKLSAVLKDGGWEATGIGETAHKGFSRLI
jgi:glutamate-1-semialdehyde 2,1-aminomutase